MRPEAADASRRPFGSCTGQPGRSARRPRHSAGTALRAGQPTWPGSAALAAELTPGIRSVPAVGHTPSHSGYLVSPGTAQLLLLLLLLGDTLQVAPVQFARPDVT